MTEYTRPLEGRANAAVRPNITTLDKWHILDALVEAASEFDIGHRQIAVLKALISFHPQRHWPVTAEQLIVFPSNRSLGQRLGGMPDSTLRRHLAQLVKAGLIARHSSPNGKRYRRGRGTAEIAFGLDLAPLVQRYGAVTEAAQAQRDAREERAAMRVRVLSLRAQLRPFADAAELIADVSRALRRKLTLDTLKAWMMRLQQRLSAVSETRKVSGTDNQNERHKEPEDRIKKTISIDSSDISPAEIDEICKERHAFFSTPLQSWFDVVRAAQDLAPMMGIGLDLFHRAVERAGRKSASIAVLLMLERFAQVRDPKGYLMAMVASPGRLDEAIRQARQANCQLTI